MLHCQLQKKRFVGSLFNLSLDIRVILRKLVAEFRGDVNDLIRIVNHPDPTENNHASHM
jgi:hypothetical protein